MIITEQRKVTRTSYENVPISGKCDICGNELLPVDKEKFPRNLYNNSDIYDYYRIATHHHDWGNDSVESYVYTDCCCIECALKYIQKYWEINTKLSPWPTNELEMKHKYKLEGGH